MYSVLSSSVSPWYTDMTINAEVLSHDDRAVDMFDATFEHDQYASACPYRVVAGLCGATFIAKTDIEIEDGAFHDDEKLGNQNL